MGRARSGAARAEGQDFISVEGPVEIGQVLLQPGFIIWSFEGIIWVFEGIEDNFIE